MMSVVLPLLFFMAVLGGFWWIHQRQKRQIRLLMSRLEALEQEPGAFGPGLDVAEITERSEPGVNPRDTPSDDVLAGYTSHIQRVVAGPGEGPVSLSDQAIFRIHQHLEDGYRPTQLADELYISLRTLERGLAEVFDCTPSQLITAMKMREARRLLEVGDLRVNEVASRLGFSSPFYFSRRFRTFFGISPSECRNIGDGDGVEGVGS
jgi:AraC-like DNA-binding protein